MIYEEFEITDEYTKKVKEEKERIEKERNTPISPMLAIEYEKNIIKN